MKGETTGRLLPFSSGASLCIGWKSYATVLRELSIMGGASLFAPLWAFNAPLAHFGSARRRSPRRLRREPPEQVEPPLCFKPHE
jgi:hypothetical protein